MEIFKTIWTALTTENEITMNIISIPCTFLEITVSMLLFTLVLNFNADKKTKFNYIIITSIISIILGIVLQNPYKSIITLIFLFLSIRYFFIFYVL